MAGIYIHIPFCARRCLYCDFFSSTNMAYKEAYLSAVVRELEMRMEYTEGEPVETIYLGGGTPSQLSATDFGKLFEAIDRFFPIADCKEITLEANPDDMTSEYVRSLRSLPFNRISMGVQSFDTEDLLFLNRRHDSKQAIRAVELCQDAGLSNISIDLIYGLPGQTEEKWMKNLEKTLQLDIPHISAYHLIYEEETKLYQLLQAGKVNAVDEETSVSLFSLLIDRLTEAGYRHYEISNFALPGCESQHNSSYWKGIKYLGLGASAHSYNGQERQWNVSSMAAYLKGIETNQPEVEIELLNTATQYNDFVITRLRTADGIDLDELQNLFGEEHLSYFLRFAEKHIRQGRLFRENRIVRFTRNGIFTSDSTMSDLLLV